jgi:hypothetical protein
MGRYGMPLHDIAKHMPEVTPQMLPCGAISTSAHRPQLLRSSKKSSAEDERPVSLWPLFDVAPRDETIYSALVEAVAIYVVNVSVFYRAEMQGIFWNCALRAIKN